MTNYNYHDFLATLGIGGAHPGGLFFTKDVLKDVQIDKNSKILDVGCGTGQTAAYLAQRYGCSITALDKHPLMIQKARQRFRRENINVQLVQGNVENIPLEDDLFDLILAESVTVFTDISKTTKEYNRVLRTGGTLLDLEMTATSPFMKKEFQEFQKLYGINHVPTEKEWENNFRKAGFQAFNSIREKWVAEELNKQTTVSTSSQEEAPEFDPSDSIDPQVYDIWSQHQSLTEKYANRLKYNVYCVK